jgi:hypothetical protein
VHNDTYICIELSGVEVTVKGPVENGQRQGRRAAYGRLCRLAGQSLSDFRDAFRSTGFSKPYWTGVAYIQSSESPQSLLPYHRPLPMHDLTPEARTRSSDLVTSVAAEIDMETNTEDYGPRDIVGYGRFPPDPQWPGGAKIAISLVRRSRCLDQARD